MKLVIHSAGIWGHANLSTWEPEDSAVVAESVSVKIGLKGKKGADIFTIRVATPAGLGTLEPREGIVATRPLLVIERWEFGIVWRWLEETVASCAAETWEASVEKLRLYFKWEYEDYKEY